SLRDVVVDGAPRDAGLVSELVHGIGVFGRFVGHASPILTVERSTVKFAVVVVVAAAAAPLIAADRFPATESWGGCQRAACHRGERAGGPATHAFDAVCASIRPRGPSNSYGMTERGKSRRSGPLTVMS